MFRVRWEKRALDELAAAWAQADAALRRRITTGSHRLDQKLRSDPVGASESRWGGRRVILLPPLGATFRIEPDGRTVSVIHVWVVRPRKQP
jgi:hypothetical protein